MGETHVAYQRLIAWQKADELALAVYKATKQFPNEELYGMTSQLRRAALSVPTNIVEGVGRQGQKSLRQFVGTSPNSLVKADYLLGFSQRLGYLSHSTYDALEFLRAETDRLRWRLSHSL